MRKKVARMAEKQVKKSTVKPKKLFEFSIQGVLFLCAAISVIVLVLVFGFLLENSIPFFQHNDIIAFLTGTTWRPINEFPSYGIVPLFVGTVLVSLVAAVIAIPIGLGCTIYLSEIASPRVRKVVKPVIEILAGVPSVIYGLFAAMACQIGSWTSSIPPPD